MLQNLHAFKYKCKNFSATFVLRMNSLLNIIVLVSIVQQNLPTLKSLIEKQTGINEQAWKKVAPCLLIY